MVAVASIGEMKWQVSAGTDPGEGHRPVVHPQVLDGLMRTRRAVSLVLATSLFA
jgi:hypothetical protein